MALRAPAMAIGCQWIHLTRVSPQAPEKRREKEEGERLGTVPVRSIVSQGRTWIHGLRGHERRHFFSCIIPLFFVSLFPHRNYFFIWQKKEEEDAMSVRTAKGLLAVCLVLSIGFLFGCAGMEYAPNKG
ncbi:MAG: hypothetical protein ACXWWW_02985, partial [Candidatus Deferrimicrobiaceae bacterium]